MKKIGIFTAYQPYVKLTQDGIGRLLIYIVGGMIEDGNDVTILCPSWHKKEIKKLLKERLLEKIVHIKTPYLFPPPLFIFYDMHLRQHQKTMSVIVPENKRKSIYETVKDWIFVALGNRSLFLLFLAVCLFFVVSFFCFFFRVIRFFFRRICHMCALLIPSKIKKCFAELNPRNFRADLLVIRIWDYTRKNELNKMIKFINKGPIDSWYVPSVFWPEVTKIKRKYALAVPDVVYAEFPHLYYQDIAMLLSARKIDDMLKAKLPLVCYSNYVANYQLSYLRNIQRRRIKVIPHSLIDISCHLKQGLSPEEIIQCFLQRCDHAIPNLNYLSSFSWKDSHFILYSSQYRYHKNIKMLLKAMSRLVHERYIDLKLVLTCANYDSLLDIIKELNLSYEIIILPSIPESVLAALNALAILHVNPSLFEGAFPFTFGEAYSVGTPSVMADIPVTREIVHIEEAEHVLFNPFDEIDMVEKIEWGLIHRNELLRIEKTIWERLANRSWKQVAKEYIDAMRFVNQHEHLPKRRRRKWKRS